MAGAAASFSPKPLAAYRHTGSTACDLRQQQRCHQGLTHVIRRPRYGSTLAGRRRRHHARAGDGLRRGGGRRRGRARAGGPHQHDQVSPSSSLYRGAVCCMGTGANPRSESCQSGHGYACSNGPGTLSLLRMRGSSPAMRLHQARCFTVPFAGTLGHTSQRWEQCRRWQPRAGAAARAHPAGDCHRRPAPPELRSL